jgi:hypothetical protein
MSRRLLFAHAFALALAVPASAATPTPTLYSDLHGKHCHTVDTSARGNSRQCSGVAGYALAVHEDDDRTTIDVLAPNRETYPLSFWDVVTLDYASVGQKAEWRMGTRHGRPAPTALLVRLTRLDARNPGEMIAVARLDRDGACVVYRGDMAEPGVERAARKAAANPASRCLGAMADQRPDTRVDNRADR